MYITANNPSEFDSNILKKIKKIVVTNNVTSIPEEAYKQLEGVTEIVLPKILRQIKHDAFLDCSSFKRVYFEGTIEDWCKISLVSKTSNPMYYANHFYIKKS